MIHRIFGCMSQSEQTHSRCTTMRKVDDGNTSPPQCAYACISGHFANVSWRHTDGSAPFAGYVTKNYWTQLTLFLTRAPKGNRLCATALLYVRFTTRPSIARFSACAPLT